MTLFDPPGSRGNSLWSKPQRFPGLNHFSGGEHVARHIPSATEVRGEPDTSFEFR